MRLHRTIAVLALVFFFTTCRDLRSQAPATHLDSFDRERVHQILKDAHNEVLKNYFDPTFRGVDIESEYKTFDAKLNDVKSLGEAFRIVAAFLSTLHDSHAFFIPPARQNRYESGFRMQMVGRKCLITQIRPDSDAAAKLHLGEWVQKFNGFEVTHEDFHDMQYYFSALAPRTENTLDLETPDGTKRAEIVKTIVISEKQALDLTAGEDRWELIRQEESNAAAMRERVYETDDAMVWKMAEFSFDSDTLGRIFGKAKKHGTLIIDLRGNPGGAIESLEMLTGRLFDHEVKIADLVARKPQKPLVSKQTGAIYQGKILVLVDSQSASCSELFARVMQLEHRGTVIGDRTAGAVMESRRFRDEQGGDYKFAYAFSITSANLLMADGKSLERVGVIPDKVMIPTPKAISDGGDIVLSLVATDAGAKLNASEAAKLFPYHWPTIK